MWYVYICDRNGQLYTGMTTNLRKRMRQHGARLLYSEEHPTEESASRREQQIKRWRRSKKLGLISSSDQQR